MIIKFTGIGLIMVSSILLGFYYSVKESYRISDLCEMKKALLILKSEIEYTLSPIPEAVESIGDKINVSVGSIFKSFKTLLETQGREGTDNLWRKALNDNQKICFFENDDFNMFISLGRVVSGPDKKLQLGTIDMIVNYIDEKTEELTNQAAKNRKLYRSLGVLGGMALCIVFV